jgi:hypothetical protein
MINKDKHTRDDMGLPPVQTWKKPQLIELHLFETKGGTMTNQVEMNIMNIPTPHLPAS